MSDFLAGFLVMVVFIGVVVVIAGGILMLVERMGDKRGWWTDE